jgi:pimeloyl-ACP methyl ester carboxylesterase
MPHPAGRVSSRLVLEELDLDGLRIGYRRAGSGAPLLLLHGGPGNGREWRGQLEGLSEEFTVIAWDMPGAGRSDDPPAAWRPKDYAGCLARFIDALGIQRPHVLGLSFGSGLALELYRWHPEIPRSLILAAAYAGWSGSLTPEMVAQRKESMRQMTELDPGAWAASWLPTLLSADARLEIVEELRGILAEFHPVAQRELVESGWAEHDARDVLPTIAVPTLLLYGERDVRSPRPVAAQLRAAIPGSRLVFIPSAGHLVSMEAPEPFNAEVRTFLRSVA